jgi:hypothetical protein
LQEKLPEKKGKMFLWHENAMSHTRILMMGTIPEFRWRVVTSYSPEQVPSYFHLFGPMKDSILMKQFANDDAVIVTIQKWH